MPAPAAFAPNTLDGAAPLWPLRDCEYERSAPAPESREYREANDFDVEFRESQCPRDETEPDDAEVAIRRVDRGRTHLSVNLSAGAMPFSVKSDSPLWALEFEGRMVLCPFSELDLELTSEAVRVGVGRAPVLELEEATDVSLDIALPAINSPDGSPTSFGTNVCFLEFV